jgi:hypothetical protein
MVVVVDGSFASFAKMNDLLRWHTQVMMMDSDDCVLSYRRIVVGRQTMKEGVCFGIVFAFVVCDMLRSSERVGVSCSRLIFEFGDAVESRTVTSNQKKGRNEWCLFDQILSVHKRRKNILLWSEIYFGESVWFVDLQKHTHTHAHTTRITTRTGEKEEEYERGLDAEKRKERVEREKVGLDEWIKELDKGGNQGKEPIRCGLVGCVQGISRKTCPHEIRDFSVACMHQWWIQELISSSAKDRYCCKSTYRAIAMIHEHGRGMYSTLPFGLMKLQHFVGHRAAAVVVYYYTNC